MKNLQLTLALASLLSANALSAANSDVIADAINDSDLETLRIVVTVGITHNNSFAVTKAQKENYKALAAAQVAKRKEASDTLVSFDSVLALDWMSLGAYVALTGSGLILVHHSLTCNENSDKYFRKIAGFGSAFLYGVGNTLRSVKDLIKNVTENRAKAKEALKKAEKVAALVDSLPVK